MSSARVSAEDLVRAWQESTSIAQCAARLGMKEGAVRARVFQMKKKGVPLKLMGNDGLTKRLDYSKLADLARQLAPVQK